MVYVANRLDGESTSPIKPGSRRNHLYVLKLKPRQLVCQPVSSEAQISAKEHEHDVVYVHMFIHMSYTPR